MNQREIIGKYLEAEVLDGSKGKTLCWGVYSRSTGDMLGTISWYGPWRQYTFNPNENATYNAQCLIDVAAFLKESRQRRKEPTP